MIRHYEYAGVNQHCTFISHSIGGLAAVRLVISFGFALYLVENSGNYGRSGQLMMDETFWSVCRVSGSEILEQP